MSKFHRAFFILEIGAVVSGGSINAQLIQSASSNLSSSSNVPGSNTGLTPAWPPATSSTPSRCGPTSSAPASSSSASRSRRPPATTSRSASSAYGDEAIHKPGNAQNDASVAGQQVTT